jgi:transposase
MSTQSLLPNPSCLRLESLRLEGGVIVFTARTVPGWAACPLCGHRSERVHSRYPRTLLDLPWQGNAVHIALTVRRFFCDNTMCERRVFAERLPAVAHRYARKTCRLADALRELAYLAGGRAMAGLLAVFAEFERDILRERVKAGIAQSRAKGKPHGRPATTAAKRQRAQELWEQGKNKSQIARELCISRSSVRALLEERDREEELPAAVG